MDERGNGNTEQEAKNYPNPEDRLRVARQQPFDHDRRQEMTDREMTMLAANSMSREGGPHTHALVRIKSICALVVVRGVRSSYALISSHSR